MQSILLFYKAVDKSVLTDGLSIPVIYQELLLRETGILLDHGQKKQIRVILDGSEYFASLNNIGFDREKYPAHKDLLQIRYSSNSPIAYKLREKFAHTIKLIDSIKAATGSTRLSNLKENEKEFIAIYFLADKDCLFFDCISNTEFVEEFRTISAFGEMTAESILDGSDQAAAILVKTKQCKIRRLSKTITNNLKRIYEYRCQICGQLIGEEYGSTLIHAHHIDYFSKSMNNDSSNILILCPNHHGIIHDTNPVFNRNLKTFIYPNGYKERLKLNRHL